MIPISKQDDPILNELISIKRLLLCALVRSGVSQGDLGKALGVTQGTVSKMLGSGISGKIERSNSGK
jgi:predicted transcriptional regulator